MEAYGLDASPALSVIAGALGAVGPKPDLVLSGINHGVNVGRSVLHSGTVGAALTASQLGISALAVSLRVGDGPDPWESAAELAVALIPLLVAAPVRTVLNLNVPHLPLAEVRGLRWARVSGAGLIKSARGAGSWEAPNVEEIEGPAAAEAARAVMEGEPDEKGEIVLTVGSPFPHSGDLGLADSGAEDATLVAQGYASLTALRGPRAEDDEQLLGDSRCGPGGRAGGLRLHRLRRGDSSTSLSRSSSTRIPMAPKTRSARGTTCAVSITMSLRKSPPLMSTRFDPWNCPFDSSAWEKSASERSQSKNLTSFMEAA